MFSETLSEEDSPLGDSALLPSSCFPLIFLPPRPKACTVDAQKLTTYTKIEKLGEGLNFQKYYIFFADQSLMRINL